MLREALDAARARDGDALRRAYADDAVWLAPDGVHRGGDAAAARHLMVAGRAAEWREPQQQGAKAALRWTAADGATGAVVVEVRRGRIIFAAES